MTVRSMTDRTNSTSNKHKTKSRGASSGLRILLFPDPSLSGRHLHFEPMPGRPSLEDPVTVPICEFWRTIGHTLEKLETTIAVAKRQTVTHNPLSSFSKIMPRNSAVTRLSIAKNHENTMRRYCAPVTTSKKEALTPFDRAEECEHLDDHVGRIVGIDAARVDHADDHENDVHENSSAHRRVNRG